MSDEQSVEQYHAHSAIGSTALRELLRSPLHYWSAYQASNRSEATVTPAMELGTMAHAAILEPDVWMSDYVVTPKIDRRTKAGKEAYATFAAAAGDAKQITSEQSRLVEAMRDAVHDHPAASSLLRRATLREASVFWECDTTGVQCKGRIDAAAEDWSIVLDVKTCRDASPHAFSRDVANRFLHVQAAHYLDGVRTAHGAEPQAFAWIAVESSAPHAVAVYVASAPMLAAGAVKRLDALTTLCKCRATGKWPAYSDRLEVLDLPAWAA